MPVPYMQKILALCLSSMDSSLLTAVGATKNHQITLHRLEIPESGTHTLDRIHHPDTLTGGMALIGYQIMCNRAKDGHQAQVLDSTFSKLSMCNRAKDGHQAQGIENIMLHLIFTD